jgi:hypothetical protein
MPVESIPGTLLRRNDDSFLAPDVLLLKAGVEDDQDAAFQATEMVKERHLQNNDPVIVTGTRGVLTTQPVIRMTDIVAQPEEVAAATAAESLAVPSPQAARRQPSRPSRRRGAGSRKPASKPPEEVP